MNRIVNDDELYIVKNNVEIMYTLELPEPELEDVCSEDVVYIDASEEQVIIRYKKNNKINYKELVGHDLVTFLREE